MADLVLHLDTQFGKRLVVAVGLENGIVAETFATTTFADNLTRDDALELMYRSLLY